MYLFGYCLTATTFVRQLSKPAGKKAFYLSQRSKATATSLRMDENLKPATMAADCFVADQGKHLAFANPKAA